LHVVDASLENNVSQEFRNICADNKITYYKKPENTRTSSHRGQMVSAAVQRTCDNLILDKFDVEEYLTHEVIAGVPPKKRYSYLYVGWHNVLQHAQICRWIHI